MNEIIIAGLSALFSFGIISTQKQKHKAVPIKVRAKTNKKFNRKERPSV